MELAILLLVLVVCLAIGVPVAFSLLAASIACFLALDIPLVVVFQRMASGVSVFTLMAIPFFIIEEFSSSCKIQNCKIIFTFLTKITFERATSRCLYAWY